VVGRETGTGKDKRFQKEYNTSLVHKLVDETHLGLHTMVLPPTTNTCLRLDVSRH
jgi:hypothetical protein